MLTKWAEKKAHFVNNLGGLFFIVSQRLTAMTLHSAHGAEGGRESSRHNCKSNVG